MPNTVRLSEEALANVQQALMAGRAEAWCLTEITEDHRLIPRIACILTITRDTIAGQNMMLIYSLAAFGPVPLAERIRAFEKLRTYARSRRCNAVTCYAHNPSVIKIMKRLGAETDTVQCTIRLDKKEISDG